MTTHSFYAFYPSDFDPRKEGKLSYYKQSRNLWKRLNQISPKTDEKRAGFAVLARALYQWATERSPMEKDTDLFIQSILKSEKNIDANADFPFFYLEENLYPYGESWYLHMINVANDNGLIVYSNLDECFYFPDGTSSPSTAREWLEQTVAEKNKPLQLTLEKIKQVMEEERKQPQTSLSPYFNREEELTQAIEFITKEFLERNGIVDYRIFYSSRKTMVEFVWGDTEIRFDFRHHLSGLGIETRKPFIYLNLEFTIRSNIPSKLLPFVGFEFRKYWYEVGLIALTLPKDRRKHDMPEYKQAVEEMQIKQRIFSVTQLYQALNEFFTIVEHEILAYPNLYSIFDAMMTGKSAILYKDNWIMPLIYKHKVYDIISTAYHVNYPNFQTIVSKALKHLSDNNLELNRVYKEGLDKMLESYEPKTAK